MKRAVLVTFHPRTSRVRIAVACASPRGKRLMPGDIRVTGTQPVALLDYSVLEWFEGKYPDFRAELEAIGREFGHKREIRYFCDEMPILGNQEGDLIPHVTIDSGQITIHETFLSYVWALSYAFLVIFDEKIHGPRTGREPLHGKPLGYFYPKGDAALNYGLGLITEFAKWPADLPSPERPGSENAYYVERANGIYVAAVDFILCHELAHIARHHLHRLKQTWRSGRDLASAQLKRFEREADKWALKRVLRGVRPPQRTLTAVGFGAIVGLGSLLFLNDSLTSRSHPDVDHRIRSLLSALPLDARDNLWGVAAAFYVAWNLRFSAGLDFSGDYEDYKTLVRAIDKQLESRKRLESNASQSVVRRKLGLWLD